MTVDILLEYSSPADAAIFVLIQDLERHAEGLLADRQLCKADACTDFWLIP
jgi:hypothetical protein